MSDDKILDDNYDAVSRAIEHDDHARQLRIGESRTIPNEHNLRSGSYPVLLWQNHGSQFFRVEVTERTVIFKRVAGVGV